MIYLATPIKHEDHSVELRRCNYATEIAAILHDAGIPVFSPASHGNERSSKRQGWKYWSKIDLPILRCCTHLIVICSEGWDCSTGVASEILTAGDIGIPVIYFDPINELRRIVEELREVEE